MSNRHHRRELARNQMEKGLLEMRRRNPKDAAVYFGKAVEIDAKDPAAHHNLACALYESGARPQAVLAVCRALELDPKFKGAAGILALILKTPGLNLRRTPGPKGVLAAYAAPDINHTALVQLAAGLILVDPAWAPAMDLRRSSDAGAAAEWLLSKAGRKALTSPLLIALLTKSINQNLVLEEMLTALRRHCLLNRNQEDLSAPPVQRLLAALAIQCAINEYLFATTEEEDKALKAIEREIEAVAADDGRFGFEVLLFALYRPLRELAAAGALLALNPKKLPEALRRVIDATLRLEEEEARLKRDLPKLAEITAETSASVAAQYEANPYPRWLSLDVPKTGSRTRHLREALGEQDTVFSDEPRDVLVAGCGTGRHALYCAMGYGEGVQVVAMDLSSTSLGYARRKALEYRVDNISFLQADILDLERLEAQFDIIEAVGVLHHLADPLAGWQQLVARLRPGGVMRIGLYRDLGRQDIMAARDYVAAQGWTGDAKEIRSFRSAVVKPAAALADATWRETIMATPDFFTASEVRDLVFHVQERNYRLPEVAAALESLGLIFGGFDRVSGPVAEFQAAFPGRPALHDLGKWWEFEQAHPGLFRRMYEFWCTRPARS